LSAVFWGQVRAADDTHYVITSERWRGDVPAFEVGKAGDGN